MEKITTGLPKAIGYTITESDGELVLLESDRDGIRSNNLTELFHFLLEPYPNTLKVVWDLDDFATPLLRLCGVKACQELVGSKHKTFLMPHRIKLFYIPRKILTIRYGSYSAHIYNLARFFPTEEVEVPITPEDVEGYGNAVIDAFAGLGMMPTTLTSPIAVYKNSLMGHYALPKMDEFPEDKLDMMKLAWEASGRQWVEAHKIGYFKETWDYDLASAYPAILASMYDWRYADIWKSDHIEPAHYGVVKGRVFIKPEVKISPIIYEAKDETLFSPTGEWDTVITLAEANTIKEYELGHIEVEEAWLAKQNTPVKPLEIPMKRLYEQRKRSKSRLKQWLLKQIAVGAYGLTAQVNDQGEPGKYFNPLWSCHCTALTRLKVFEFIKRHHLEDNLIHIGVDGVLTDKPVELGSLNGEGMGQWQLSHQGEALVVSSGSIWHNDRKPQGLMLDEVLKMIRAKPSAGYFGTKLPRRLTLTEAVNASRIEDVGTWIEGSTTIDLIMHPKHDREFKELPRNGRQLLNNTYTSTPLRI